MYIPTIFKNTNISLVKEFITANAFGILVSQVNGKPWATHIPLLLTQNDEGKDILSGHISKGNTQWKEFEKQGEVLAIFNGPHAYISSSWYDHENVPTWNYMAVHMYGKIKIIEGEALLKQLSKLVEKYESGLKNPVSVGTMSKEFLDKEIKGIVGFEIEITEIQAASKLSQNRDETNYKRIIQGLEEKGDDESKRVAKIMKEQS